jgi:hypothetical protein
MKKTYKRRYKVRCCKCEKLFDIVLDIVEGTEMKMTTVLEKYCPECKAHVSVTVDGEIDSDDKLIRKVRI